MYGQEELRKEEKEMKNTDIALIILIASISVVASYLLGNAILGNPSDRVESVSYMEPIGSSIEQPDVETFNAKALNPTVEVYVGNCGPLEEWNEAEHVCKKKGENNQQEDEEKEEEKKSDSGADADADGDADADADTETSTGDE